METINTFADYFAEHYWSIAFYLFLAWILTMVLRWFSPIARQVWTMEKSMMMVNDMSVKFRPLQSMKDFDLIKVDSQLMIIEDESRMENPTIRHCKVVQIKKEDWEVILDVKNNIYFDYIKYINRGSWAKKIYLIEK